MMEVRMKAAVNNITKGEANMASPFVLIFHCR
ncbi:acetyl-coenzyme A synthetase [Bacillus sp. NRRL B-14911]|nr:acetyl-coenzyme A synthetase [Bacillus sp. NRRL B-14911]